MCTADALCLKKLLRKAQTVVEGLYDNTDLFVLDLYLHETNCEEVLVLDMFILS